MGGFPLKGSKCEDRNVPQAGKWKNLANSGPDPNDCASQTTNLLVHDRSLWGYQNMSALSDFHECASFFMNYVLQGIKMIAATGGVGVDVPAHAR